MKVSGLKLCACPGAPSTNRLIANGSFHMALGAVRVTVDNVAGDRFNMGRCGMFVANVTVRKVALTKTNRIRDGKPVIVLELLVVLEVTLL